MGKSLMVNGGPGTSQLKNLTRFHVLANAAPIAQSSEGNAQLTQRTAGTYSKMYVRVESNAADGDTTFTFRKDTGGGSLDGNQIITVASGVTGEFFVGSATDHVNVENKICCKVVTGNSEGTGAVSFTIIAILFEPDDATLTVVRHASTGATDLSDGRTYYFAPSDIIDINSLTETNAEFKVGAAGTIKNLYAKASSNVGLATTITVRKNEVDTALTLTIGATVTTPVEDTTHSFTVAVGDTVSVASVTLAGLSVIPAIISFEFVSTESKFHSVFGNSGTLFFQNFNLLRYVPIGGGGLVETSELQVKTEMQIAGTASKFTVQVGDNTLVH